MLCIGAFVATPAPITSCFFLLVFSFNYGFFSVEQSLDRFICRRRYSNNVDIANSGGVLSRAPANVTFITKNIFNIKSSVRSRTSHVYVISTGFARVCIALNFNQNVRQRPGN